MDSVSVSQELLNMLYMAITRELQVSIQYMLQHTIWSIQSATASSDPGRTKQGKFVGSHSPVWLPGSSLKRIAITEMRHAEAVAERVVQLGKELPTQPPPITIGKTLQEILTVDKEQEEMAIQLYNQIISTSGKESDRITERLFEKILLDEEKHLRIFSDLLNLTKPKA